MPCCPRLFVHLWEGLVSSLKSLAYNIYARDSNGTGALYIYNTIIYNKCKCPHRAVWRTIHDVDVSTSAAGLKMHM